MNNRTAYVALICLTLFCCAQSSFAADTTKIYLTLEQCREMALENNADIKNAELDLQAAKAQRQEALAEYFPTVSANAFGFHALDPMIEIGVKDILGNSTAADNLNYIVEQLAPQLGISPTYTTMQHGYMASVSLIQPVFAGGRIVNGNRLAALGVDAASTKKNIVRRTTTEEVEKNYWQIVSLEEKLSTLGSLSAMLDTLQRDVSSACAAGLATESDLLQVELKRNELKSGRLQIENGIRLAKMNMLNSIGMAYTPYPQDNTDSIPCIDDIVLSDTIGGLNPPMAYYMDEADVAVAQDETRLLDLSVSAKKIERNMVIGEALPEIGIGAPYGYSNFLDRDNLNGAVYVSVKVPISDWGKKARKIQRYDSQIRKAENEKEYLSSQIELQIRQLWFNLETSWQQLQVSRESIATAEASVRKLAAHYRAGLVPLSELLEAQTQLQQCTDNYTDQCIAYRTTLRAYLDRTGGDM